MSDHTRPLEPGRCLLDRVEEFLAENPAPPRSNRRASAARHTRKCGVCRPPEREAIEADYLNFRSPDRIARDCGIADHSSVYRHVHAAGLAAKRKAPLRRVLESIIEQAETVRPTGTEVIRAVYMYTQINGAGEWVGSPGRRSGEAWGINPPSLSPPAGPDRSHPSRSLRRS
jgi:hypothetical protein